MSVRGLAKALRSHPEHRHLRGTSDSGVRHYVEEAVLNPRMDLIRAMADVLGVRWQKLAYDEGGWTAHQEKARIRAARIKAEASPPREDLQSSRLKDAVFKAMDLPVPKVTIGGTEDSEDFGVLHGVAAAPLPPWIAPLAELWLRLVSADFAAGVVVVDVDLEANIGKALRAPLDALGIDPSRMREAGSLTHYILAMLPALLMLAGERARQGLENKKEIDNA